MSTTNLNLRIDSNLKRTVGEILEEMGMNFTTAVNIYFKQIKRTGSIPFSISADIPNETTKKAIEEAERLLADPNTKRYHSVDELFADIEGMPDDL